MLGAGEDYVEGRAGGRRVQRAARQCSPTRPAGLADEDPVQHHVAGGIHVHGVVECKGQDSRPHVQIGAGERRQRAVRKAQAQRNDVHGALFCAARCVPIGADGQVRHAVAVQVARCQGRSKVVQAGQAGAAVRGIVNLKGALCRAVRIHQHYVHGALAAGVVIGADGQVRHAVAVQVARGRDRYPEVVVVGEAGAAVRVVGDLGRAARRAVCVHQHDVHGAPVGVVRPVNGGAGRQVRHAVAVDIAHGCHGSPEDASVGQRGAAVRVVGDLGRAACRAVCVHQHDVHGAPAAAAARVVPGGAHRQVGHRVAVQVQGRH